MKNRKILIIGMTLVATLVTGVVASASSDSVALVKDIIGGKSYKQAKEEIKVVNNETKKLDDIRLEANKHKNVSEFKQVEELPGFVPDEKLKNAEYKLKTLMTYEDSYNQGYTDQIIYEIDPARMVYVIQVKSHEELDYDGKKIKNPLITSIHDAETGEKISFLWQAEQ